ncbi:MAG: hypothetical protein QOF08_280 [Gaiellales bacterium]|jgi:hypothetical protein|nr:hypothetical protein [Gaiellales bacterium]
MHLVRDLLDQVLRDPDGHPAGRADDFSIRIHEEGIYVEAILTGGGILADDLGILGRACERLCRLVRRRPLRRASIPWSAVSEVAEHALTVPGAPAGNDRVARATGGIRLRVARRVPARSADGIQLHLIDLQVVDPRPRERLRVAGLIVRRRHRIAWPISLRPRQRGASLDWRFVKAADVRLTPSALVVDRTFDTLVPTRDGPASRPPKRRPRSRS